jgi:hypothetical protein
MSEEELSVFLATYYSIEEDVVVDDTFINELFN